MGVAVESCKGGGCHHSLRLVVSFPLAANNYDLSSPYLLAGQTEAILWATFGYNPGVDVPDQQTLELHLHTISWTPVLTRELIMKES